MNSKQQMPSMGVLKFEENGRTFHLHRYSPSADIGTFVKHYWVVSWDLTGHPPYPQEVIPNPCVNMVIEPGRSGIFGPSKQKFTYMLQGKGCVFGVKFKPGGFYPFVKQPISRLNKQIMNIHSVFGIDAGAAEALILSQRAEEDMVRQMEAILQPKLPKIDPQVEVIVRITERIMEDREIIKVDTVCKLFDMNKRTLQRLFDQYVGVNPKWVIQLYRLQNAAELIGKGRFEDGLELSMELGYYDQSHFIKDFKAITGKTPEEYASSL
ncbi:DUF6597 domain-containing transcriptional factor [Marinicrinis lubricantis]|uniref:DUF6597 domain-containing transcriptional factor n=1 Tax=Marinicrinis lubricantis TaxID=2086470 RepID=A0ABW1IS23_9BACL